MPLLFASILFASFNSVLLHRVRLARAESVYRFNLIGAAVWVLCLLCRSGFRLHVDGTVLLFGVLYGVTQALFVFFKTVAMNSGPVCITTLIGNSSLLVSIGVCYFLFGEPVTPGDGVGLCLLLIALSFVALQGERGRARKIWYPSAALFLVCGAGVGIAFKAFSKSAAAARADDMMITAACVMLLCYLVLCGISVRQRGDSPATEIRAFLLAAIASGALACAYNRLNVYLAGELDAILFFPAFNGGVVFCSALLGVMLLGERLSPKRLLALLLCIAGIVIIGIF